MAESSRQKRIAGRVMHEFKHGELKSGRGRNAGKVKNRRQAIAIALQEAGAQNMTVRSVIAATFIERKPTGGPPSKSARAKHISALIVSARAPGRWRAATRENRPLAATAPR